ncbi:hypothetical protein DIPPA_12916 [Diplonema papillatum]|nr:hypothetical protein DIPPA_12916 [Diplonema papillatum]
MFSCTPRILIRFEAAGGAKGFPKGARPLQKGRPPLRDGKVEPRGERGGFGALGREGAKARDEMPGHTRGSPEARTADFMSRLNLRGAEMDRRRSWGRDRSDQGEGQHRDIKFDPGEEKLKDSDFWRLNYSHDLNDHAGEEGIGVWKEAMSGDIRLASAKSQKKYAVSQERTDVSPYMQWLVPPKRVRLENVLRERVMHLRKTPEYDMTPGQLKAVQRMWDGLETATAKFPLPFPEARENFCITHIECVDWNSREKWAVCWKLVLDDEQRPEYERALSGGVVSKWSKIIRHHFNPSAKGFMPQIGFTYDEGSIPYKQSIIEQNIERSQSSRAPLPMHGYNKDLWGITVEHQSLKQRKEKQNVDPVRDFLLEARAALGA